MQQSSIAALCILVLSCSDEPRSQAGASSGDSRSDGIDTSRSGGTASEICVATINEYRKTKGLPPYARWTENEGCSDGQAASDGQTSAPHGAFGTCQERAQNECPGWPGPAETMIPDCLEAMWREGPGGGHYEAMASARYTKVACGFAGGKGGIWSVQNFR